MVWALVEGELLEDRDLGWKNHIGHDFESHTVLADQR
jgi:hypothetical protein